MGDNNLTVWQRRETAKVTRGIFARETGGRDAQNSPCLWFGVGSNGADRRDKPLKQFFRGGNTSTPIHTARRRRRTPSAYRPSPEWDETRAS